MTTGAGDSVMELARAYGDVTSRTSEAGIEQVVRRQTRVDDLQRQVERLAETMRVAVVFGGDKNVPGAVINPTFNPRHWKSYEAVAEDIAAALRRIGFRHVVTMPDDMHLGERLRRHQVHFAWLNTGGVQGLGSVGHAPAMLEMFGIPYVGHNPLSAATMDCKNAMKRDLMLAGIPTAPFMVWHPNRGSLKPGYDLRLRNAFGAYEGPFIAKPISGRASRHVVAVDHISGLAATVEGIYAATDNPVLIERFLPGREFCIAVCGEVVAQQGRLIRLGHPFAFAAVERMLDPDERVFTSMDHRPITTDRVRSLNPASEAALYQKLVEIGRLVYSEFDIETLIRLDVRADDRGALFVLEANPKPDLAAPVENRTSIVCAGLDQEGMTYDDLILSLIADRVDVLFSERRAVVDHLTALLN
ncbi:MAG: D-alanyl-alanine synthetase [Alphaproteobacteria bacterium]